ncbi:class A beta-lactamase [Silvimonas iriomotensis]|uniref:Beta-lactamase n=1 Tax=Silvimonas iriomotensis TaxID=449662 RepID=A0ABQ2PBX2_9NEIS|nr:class A beta-lactamase [Silvimonas iriomotensis]GGP22750.1 beta-lactamase [Silvimonas iriomotensis]
MPLTSGLSRRQLLTGAAALFAFARLPALAAGQPASTDEFAPRFAAIENRLGGRLGVFALDTGNGKSIAHRVDERFPLCSTFKLLLAACVLSRVDAGAETLNRPVRYSQADLLSYAPITKAHVSAGQMTVAELCAAALQYSDNTAANLLLADIGGPARLTAWLRAQGDTVTRLDRNEPTLNTALPGDERDTTTPRAMVQTMQRILLEDHILRAPSRTQLDTWLAGNTTGNAKLHAGLPADWQVGDKTGSGDNGASNDVAIIRPPQRAPILVACYYVGSTAPADAINGAHADVGRIVKTAFSS